MGGRFTETRKKKKKKSSAPLSPLAKKQIVDPRAEQYSHATTRVLQPLPSIVDDARRNTRGSRGVYAGPVLLDDEDRKRRSNQPERSPRRDCLVYIMAGMRAKKKARNKKGFKTSRVDVPQQTKESRSVGYGLRYRGDCALVCRRVVVAAVDGSPKTARGESGVGLGGRTRVE